MDSEDINIWSGNNAYRMDELKNTWTPPDVGVEANPFTEFYKNEEITIRANLQHLEDKVGEYKIAFRSDTGKVVLFSNFDIAHIDLNNKKQQYLDLLAMKDSDGDLFEKLCKFGQVKDVVYNMKENTKTSNTILSKNLPKISPYATKRAIARFAWLNGINLQDCEMILVMDCFDNGWNVNNTPIIIDRSLMKFIEVICSFGVGHFKWGDGTKRINSPLEQKDGDEYLTKHTLTDVTLYHKKSDVALSDVYEITDEENEQMSKIIQEAI